MPYQAANKRAKNPKSIFDMVDIKTSKFKSDSQNQEESLLPEKAQKIAWWLIGLLVLLLIIMSTSLFMWWYVASFEKASGTSLVALSSTLRSALKNNLFSESNQINLMLLGLDIIDNRSENSLLTDTIILITIKQDGSVYLIPFPRDLWIDDLKTKINALYYYGEESLETTGNELVQTVFGQITNQPIDHILLIKLATVKHIIDALGGIEIDVNNSFTDEKFPRDNIDITSQDPTILYETISFQAGKNVFDGTTALKFIRSRNSEDEIEGTDLARSARQQQVIDAIINKIKTNNLLLDPTTLGSLYKIWNQDIESTLTDENIIGLGLHLSQQKSIVPLTIPVNSPKETGIIYHPPVSKHSLWVYEPIDPTWNEFQHWLQQALDQ